MQYLISILIPAYNAERTITRCLDSVFSQTVKNYEVIVVDDGSTDSTYAICQSFLSRTDKMKLYTQTNEGISKTRQKLVDLASGDYLQFVDADDWIEPKMIENLNSILLQKRYDIIISDFFVDYIKKTVYSFQKPTSLNTVSLIKDLSSSRLIGALWNKLISSDLLKGVDFPNLQYCEDWCICAKLFQKTDLLFYNHNAFYHYDCRSNNSLVRNITKESFKYRIQYINYLKEIEFDKLHKREFNSQVADIAYTAIVYRIYSKTEFMEIFKGISFLNSYVSNYKKLFLVMSKFFDFSFLRFVDMNIRKIMHKK